MIYYHDSGLAGGNVALSREIETGRIALNLTATANANLNANLNLGIFNATYVFATPVLGGRASVGLMGIFGGDTASFAGLLTGTLSGCSVPFSRFDEITSSLTAFGD
jgi:hypothetical protein